MRSPFHLQLLFFTLLLFAAAQGAALFVTEQLAIMRLSSAPTLADGGVVAYFLLFFFAVTLFFLILFHIYRGNLLYRIIFLLAVFAGLLKVFELVFPVSLSMVVAVFFILGLFLLPVIWVHDLIIILAGAGIGAVFGIQFHWSFAILLLAILSVYDIIAVFVTKHMIVLAHELIKRSCSFALIVPEHWRNFRFGLMEVKPGSGFLILGGGDVILPMFLTASAYLTQPSAAVTAIVGMCIGVTINHIWLMGHGHPLPALPFIVLGGVVGMLLGFI